MDAVTPNPWERHYETMVEFIKHVQNSDTYLKDMIEYDESLLLDAGMVGFTVNDDESIYVQMLDGHEEDVFVTVTRVSNKGSKEFSKIVDDPCDFDHIMLAIYQLLHHVKT